MTAPGTFWARRRAAVQAEADAERLAAERQKDEARVAELAERDDAEVLAEMGLPDPVDMKQGDDFAAFMSRDVPEHLRRRALRSLWRSNPVLACVDGLNDYDDDYRTAALAGGHVKTAYQVGKGMLRHIEEMTRQAQAATDPSDVTDGVPETAQTVQTEPVELPQSDTEAASCEGRSAPAGESEVASAPAPRRMRFRFEEASA